MNKVVVIGSGNVATHLSLALNKSGINIVQVWSKSLTNARLLAIEVNALFTNNLNDLVGNADLYIISIKDDAITSVLEQFPHKHKNIIHTAGSIAMEVLKPYSENCGVLYPLQTFSKNKTVDFKEIPVLIEANTYLLERQLTQLAEGISNKVSSASSEQRKYLHIAAVFACNFTNYFYALAQQMLEDKALEFDLIRPLILETAQKAMLHSPAAVQTGPAVRKDQKVVNAHIELLKDNPALQKLYADLSERIMTL